MVAPGFSKAQSFGRRATALRLARAPGIEPLGDFRIGQGNHGGGQQRGIGCPRLADRQRADRNPARHLQDRKQRILAFQRMRVHRHAEDGQRGHRCGHAGQVRRAPGTGDDDLEPGLARAACELVEPLRRAMGGHDAGVVTDSQGVKRFCGVLHRGPVRLAAHDDRDRF